MKLRPLRKSTRRPLLAAAVAAAALCALASGLALAAGNGIEASMSDGEVVAYSVDPVTDEETDYISIDDAMNAGYEGKTIVMAKDWELSDSLVVSEGKKITIDMHAHTIKYATGIPVKVRKGSELTLTSSESKEFSYKGYDSKTGDVADVTSTTGGLVTQGASSYDPYYGFLMLENSKVNLEGVTIAGNRGTVTGGVYMNENATLNMSKGASIEHNLGSYGGGVDAHGKNDAVNMDDASISGNYSDYGAGIFVLDTGARISMVNGAQISSNIASLAGGGVYFTETDFELTSSDKTGLISSNKCLGSSRTDGKAYQSGGGIHIDQVQTSTNKGLIEGMAVSKNYSAYDGGGLELDQENTTLKNCTITDNTCKYEGGGIYVCNDGNVIDGCTITGNACNRDGSNYEGGGVFVWHSYDIKLLGVCLIKGNTRGQFTHNPDDVMLRENGGATAKAYITGSLSKGSSVGVRTGITGDRRIAKNFTHETDDCLFIDLDGYYASYGTDEGGDAWQRRMTKEYDVGVNDISMGRYKYGDWVTVNGASKDASKVFKCWNTEDAVGLYPISSYISEYQAWSPSLSFTMPQNNVSITAEYMKRADEVRLYVDRPIAGKDLPTSGTFAWDADDADWRQTEVAVSWLEKDGDAWAPASGKAKYGATYAAVVSVGQNAKIDLAFVLDIDASKQQAIIGGYDQGVVNASVDASGRLTMQSGEITADKATVSEVDALYVEVEEGISEQSFLSQIPAAVAARTNAGTAVALTASTSGADFSGIVSGGKVVKPEGGQATVKLPVSYEGSDVRVPDGMTAELVVAVRDAPAEPVAEPTVNPEGGTYSTTDDADKFVDGKLKVEASCSDDATLRYSLSSYADGAWQRTVEDAEWPEGGLMLAAKAGSQAGYKLEVWAETADADSAHRILTYVVDDVQPAEKVVVTVKYDDTAADGQHASWAGDEFKVDKGSDIVLTAPVRTGYAFEKWLASDGTTVLGTDATLKLEDVSSGTTVTALYNPAVAGLDVSLSIPTADEALAQSAEQVKAKLADSDAYVDVTSYFAGSDGKVAVTWSPAARTDGKAAHDTCYAASLALDTSASGSVKYLLAQGAEVLVNGNPVDGAYVVEEDGKTSVCVECPNTGALEYKSVETLSPVSMSFEDALAAKKAQDAGEDISAWNLPSTVKVTYVCGETEDYDIAWSSIDELDESAKGAQELTATGTISFPDYVEHDGLTETVTVKVKVAASGLEPATTDISSAKVVLSKKSFAYNGKVRRPSVKRVVLAGKVLKAGTDYTVAVKGGKRVGTYKVTVTGKGSYAGKVLASYTIVPARVTKVKASASGAAGAVVSWARHRAQTGGFEVRWVKGRSAPASAKKASKATVKGAKAKSFTATGLKASKRYGFQVRAYKVVGGKKYWSAWSKVATARTAKWPGVGLG